MDRQRCGPGVACVRTHGQAPFCRPGAQGAACSMHSTGCREVGEVRGGLSEACSRLPGLALLRRGGEQAARARHTQTRGRGGTWLKGRVRPLWGCCLGCSS